MTINEYQQEALRTETDIKTKYPSLRLLHGLIEALSKATTSHELTRIMIGARRGRDFKYE